MKYKIVVPTCVVRRSIELALSRPAESRGDFFHEIRAAFKEIIATASISCGLEASSTETPRPVNYLSKGVHHRWQPIIKNTGRNGHVKCKLDLEFCSRYGHDDYSLTAINYLDRALTHLPALSSLPGLSIGNIMIQVENKDCELEIELGQGISSTGYAYHISRRKRKSYFCLFGVMFHPEFLRPIIERRLIKHTDSKERLDEIRLGAITYPIIYIDRITARLFTCSCFSEHFNVAHDIERLLPYGNSEEEIRNRVRNITPLDGICHLCNGGIPKQTYGHRMYYSSFMQRYLPYHNLTSRIKHGRTTFEGKEYRQIENELRERFGYPKVGHQWVVETTVYKAICRLFPDYQAVRHYRGRELEGLELDIWLPDLKVGVEYQGEQHYKPVKHWGGKAGLERRIANDRRKRVLCKKLGYHLVEVKYTEELSDQLLKDKLAAALNKKLEP